MDAPKIGQVLTKSDHLIALNNTECRVLDAILPIRHRLRPLEIGTISLNLMRKFW